MFRETSQSRSTSNESFLLGVAGDGDYFKSTTGSLTGNLLAGHNYRFFFNSLIQAFGPSGETLVAATANGNVTLQIGSVPEPPFLALMTFGLAGIGRMFAH